MTNPSPMPEFDVPIAEAPTGRTAVIWWEWFQSLAKSSYTKEESDVRYEPFDSAYTKTEADARYVNVTGDTMSGALTVTGGDINIDTYSPSLGLNKPASGYHNGIYGRTNGKQRWLVSLGDDAAETGSNAGSNFLIYRANDAGTYIDAPFSVNRATGAVMATGLAPTPTAAAAVGQWRALAPGSGAAFTIPAGGTWAWACYGYNATTLTIYSGFFGGVAAGGTAALGATANVAWSGFCWRIA